jgi:hypothetical protein
MQGLKLWARLQFMFQRCFGGLMRANGEEPAIVTQFIRKVGGGSQAILAKASDGKVYVVKFKNNLQGPNLLFNESMGTALFRAAGLPVPIWRLLILTDQFIECNPRCWSETPSGFVRPQPGLCFGSRFLGDKSTRLFEILPGNSFLRIRNRTDFWLAWLIDVCAGHADNRQAIFRQDTQGSYQAVFIDHGHMFCSPKGNLRPHVVASRYYLDPRIYPNVCSEMISGLRKKAAHLDCEGLWARLVSIPDEWMTPSAISNFAECLQTLSDSRSIEKVIEVITRSHRPHFEVRRDDPPRGQYFGDSILRARIQNGGDRFPLCA